MSTDLILPGLFEFFVVPTAASLFGCGSWSDGDSCYAHLSHKTSSAMGLKESSFCTTFTFGP